MALENARLFEETRQRAAELAIVNDIGQALAERLELDALIERLGDQLQEAFSADIVYVALHDESSDLIEFAYYVEDGVRGPAPQMRYGEGLTSQILQSRAPLLLNREEAFEEFGGPVGTPARSYLGVPIVVGSRAIGAVSVQSTRTSGLYGEAETRLLATIAAQRRGRDPERAAVPRGPGGARGRRAGQRGEERVPRRHEPRDPHADERDHRDERPAAGDARSTPSSATTPRRSRTAARPCSSIINDILDFSKIEAGRMDLERAPFDLRAVHRVRRGPDRPRRGEEGPRGRLRHRARARPRPPSVT